MSKSLVSSDTVKVRTSGNSVYLDSSVYSTTEQIVNTWIDYKPIYRKVVEFTGTINSETWTPINLTNLGINNVDNLFIKDIILDLGSNLFEPVFSNNNRVQYLKNSQQISFYLYASPVKVTLILEYTKTTD